jgi:signal transduction histidine kinase
MGEEVSFELYINGQYQLYNASPLIEENGEMESILVVVENIDDRKLLEAQIEKAAAMAERDRLASELHDAVTQTLYSASVMAEATPHIWDQDEATGRQYLEQLPIMLRGALAEMRILLLELRPEALRELTLGQLLEPMTESTRAFTRATVTLKVESDRKLPEDVTMTLYRIVQECMNNITKHAEASQVNIWLCADREGVEINISDDGRGFDLESIPPGHLGIGIMRDRAQKIGAYFKIESEPGSGTLIILTWTNQSPSISEK